MSTMLDVAVIEDDPIQLELLASMVEDCLKDEGAFVERCASSDALVDCLSRGLLSRAPGGGHRFR